MQRAFCSPPIPALSRRSLALPLLGALLALCVWLLPAAPALAAAPAPAWSLSAVPYPSNFEPGVTGTAGRGPGFLLTVINVGGAASSGEIEISDELPPGLLLAAGTEGQVKSTFSPLLCAGSGRNVSCTTEDPVRSGDAIIMYVPVEVEASAPEGTIQAGATVSGGGAGPTSTSAPTTISSTRAPFDFLPSPAGFFGPTTNADGSAATQAGSRPYQLTIGLHFPYYLAAEPRATAGGVKDVEVNLPRGVAVNPTATPTCAELQLEEDTCPPAAAVGVALTALPISGLGVGFATVYNMVPESGSAAELAFEVTAGVIVHLQGGVRSDGEYVLFASSNDTLAKVPVFGAEVTLWGNPSAESHDYQREAGTSGEEIAVERTNRAFLTLPSDCSGAPLVTAARADSWREPGLFHASSYQSTDLAGNPVAVGGCGALAFQPSVGAQPTTTRADSPTGLDFNLHVPQNENYEELATANLKDAKVTLPPGMVVNPSSANGLAACGEAQIGRLPDVEGKLRFSESPQSCPEAAKLGTVEVTTPLLKEGPEGARVPHVLPGSIYLAAPKENPFGSLLAIYLAVEDEQSGIIAKLAGNIEPNSVTGQLTASFAENPELPLEDVSLHFFGGERAPLKTPTACGQFSAASDLTPWSSPQAPDASPSGPPFTINAAPPGGACGQEAQLPHRPGFEAGTVNPLAGTYSPFVLKLDRPDGTQRITAIDTTLPAGLTGKLSGVPYCPEAAIAAAAGKSGRAEQAAPSCPAASGVGTVTVGAGAGNQPYYVSGNVYLAGPYKGAPISLAIITPAVAGPFDLGNVVTLVALYVNETTAQIHAVSDPLPTILQGIPLDVRSIALSLDRPDFTLNPTNCEPTSILGAAAAPSGALAALSTRFQVGGCNGLPFKPRLALRVYGKTNRNAKPRFRAVLQTKPGEANITRAQVNLPHSEFLEQAHIKTICTRVQFNAGAVHGEQCPKGSIYGHAKAFTPLLDKPLQGPVYLRSSSHKLPDLVAALGGQIDIALAGKVDSGPNAGIRNTFEVVPDAPVSKFIIELKGGKKGLLVNSENLCSKGAKIRGIARFTGQNGKVHQFKPHVANSCNKRKHPKRHHHDAGKNDGGHHQGKKHS